MAGSAYCRRHVLDHAHQAPRSGPLPRALGAVSNVLTGPTAHLTSPSLVVTGLCCRWDPCAAPVPSAPGPAGPRPTSQERHVHHHHACGTPPHASGRAHAGRRRHRPPRPAARRRPDRRRAGGRAAAARAVRASRCSPCRRCCSRWVRCAASRPRRTRWLFRTLVRPAPGAADRVGGPRAAAVRPGRRPGVRRRRPGRLRWPAPPLVGQVAVGLALVAALLNAVFAFCLGCEVYLLARRSHRLTVSHHPAVHHQQGAHQP